MFWNGGKGNGKDKGQFNFWNPRPQGNPGTNAWNSQGLFPGLDVPVRPPSSFISSTLGALNEVAGLGQLCQLGSTLQAAGLGGNPVIPNQSQPPPKVSGPTTAADGKGNPTTSDASAIVRELEKFRDSLRPSAPSISGSPSGVPTPMQRSPPPSKEATKRSFASELNANEDFKKVKSQIDHVRQRQDDMGIRIEKIQSAQEILGNRSEKIERQVTDVQDAVKQGNERVESAILELARAQENIKPPGGGVSSTLATVGRLFTGAVVPPSPRGPVATDNGSQTKPITTDIDD